MAEANRAAVRIDGRGQHQQQATEFGKQPAAKLKGQRQVQELRIGRKFQVLGTQWTWKIQLNHQFLMQKPHPMKCMITPHQTIQQHMRLGQIKSNQKHSTQCTRTSTSSRQKIEKCGGFNPLSCHKGWASDASKQVTWTSPGGHGRLAASPLRIDLLDPRATSKAPGPQ